VATTFVLVHGAWHGAWCWERLVPELERRGAAVIAVDLPGDEPAAGLADYRNCVLAAARDAEDVVLVGHSLAGATVPLVAAARAVRALVLLCALVPQPGLSLSTFSDIEPEMFASGFGDGIARDEQDRSYWQSAEAATAALYPDCADEIARSALARLRPQARRPNTDAFPLDAWPDVRTASIVCTADAAIAPDWSRRTARERLGIEAIELPGGHSPFLARPALLAETLLEVA
jgi:pimeloyl-ACP methyl ester carboxylesterase